MTSNTLDMMTRQSGVVLCCYLHRALPGTGQSEGPVWREPQRSEGGTSFRHFACTAFLERGLPPVHVPGAAQDAEGRGRTSGGWAASNKVGNANHLAWGR